MKLDIDHRAGELIRERRVARLATADEGARPSVVPICYAFDGEHIYSPLDEKPKSVAPRQLKRVRNIEVNPQVALVIDDYSEDWSKLYFVLIRGAAQIIERDHDGPEHAHAVALLREKYPQYRRMAIDSRAIIKITPGSIKLWSAGE
ncbi:MAG TPA: TIGR03668 family PPOX class F420-dependent oxidoreductase [Blastocatellia bacterium]|nr:TIGR03668 family PPOX class F420-dependent oxidoreductase [Blastocatellia bacterium]